MVFQRHGISRPDKEVWFWYEMIEKYKNSYLPKPQFCQENKLEPKMFQNMYYRIVYKEDSNPEEYHRMIKLANKFIESEDKLKDFSKKHMVTDSQLSSTITHLSYKRVIDRIKESKIPKSETASGFIEVPQNIESKPFAPNQLKLIECPPNPPTLPEVVEKKNDIEIIIQKGVKVCISPNIEPMRVIKIIELLQEL